MAYAVTVVVEAGVQSLLKPLIGSLDVQSLPASEFELVVVDRGLSEDARSWLYKLASRRTNIRVVDRLPEDLAAWAVVATDVQRFFGDGLRQLLAFADARQVQVVLARRTHVDSPVGPGLLEDRVLKSPPSPDLVNSAVVMTDSRRLTEEPTGLAVRTAGAATGVFASYPVAEAVPGDVSSAAALEVTDAFAEWDGSVLLLTASGTVTGLEGSARPVVLLRSLRSGVTYLADTDGSVGAEEVGGPAVADGDANSAGARRARRWALTARVRPRDPLGAPLLSGQWLPEISISEEHQVLLPVALPVLRAPGAIVGGAVVSTGTDGRGRFVLDVGATSTPLVSAFSSEDARVHETAQGSVLTLTLPGVHVDGDQTVPDCSIGLDQLTLPARLQVLGDRAEIVAFLSGIAGTYALKVRLGRKAAATGLTVVVDGRGMMTVVATPPPTPPAPTTPKKSPPRAAGNETSRPSKGRARRQGKNPPSGPVARLRRALPGWLQPTARRISHHPTARRWYRKLTGLSR